MNTIDSFLLCDTLAQTFERGEFQKLTNHAALKAKVESIGSFLKDPTKTEALQAEREKRGGLITVFDTSGVAVQDVYIAKLACEVMGAPPFDV